MTSEFSSLKSDRCQSASVGQTSFVVESAATPLETVQNAISFDDYTFAYAGATKPALRNISFTLPRGSFTVLSGISGSGKSTLLRAMKPELAVAGTSSGTIRLMGKAPSSLKPVESATLVGFVQQDPINQLVTDTVWHELAFGLENIGMERETMRRRVAETAHFFGIGSWFDRKVSDLSGGQKQLLNLAAIVVMQPHMLMLDEPTSQLDPIAAKDFLDVLGRVNAELGITVVIIEHRLEDVIPLADHVLFLKAGALVFDGEPRTFTKWLMNLDDAFVEALPAAARLGHLLNGCVPSQKSITSPDEKTDTKHNDERLHGASMPVTVREGRTFLLNWLQKAGILDAGETLTYVPAAPNFAGNEVALWCSDVWFRYSKTDPFVLRGVDVKVYRGQVAAIVGGNGSGKSTLLGALSGIRKPERGKVRKQHNVKVAMLAQDPKTLFVCDTLFDDLSEWREYGNYDDEKIYAVMDLFGLTPYVKRHPYDLSGGEIQKAALAKVLLLDPDVLLLDEPVKGIDVVAKREIATILTQLAREGKAILLTSHDLEFVAQTADICMMMFGCEITCVQDCHGFFQDNLFYSTATSRISRDILDGCVITDDVREALTHAGIVCSTDLYGADNASVRDQVVLSDSKEV